MSEAAAVTSSRAAKACEEGLLVGDYPDHRFGLKLEDCEPAARRMEVNVAEQVAAKPPTVEQQLLGKIN